MAAAAQKNFLKNLGCPVCLDVCTDPRMLPCPQGGHTLCKRCLDGLVRGPTITCPECRAKHNVPPSGSDGFPRNIMAAGLIDSLCKECRMAHPEVTCTHCDKMLCRSCHVAHQAFDTVKQSFGKLQVVIWKGGKDVKEAEIKRLGVAIEHDIDQAMDQLADQLEDRRKTLKAELRKIIKEHMDSIKPWRKEVDRKISEAQTYLDKANRELGDKYRDRITNQQMTDITSQSQHKIKEIKLAISKAPSPSKPVLRYNSRQAITTISSFGSIELLPVDTEDCPIAVDTGPLTLDKPRVVGKEGSDPDILDTAIASLYLMATLMGKDLWMYVQGMPHLFSVGGLFYQQIERDLGLTDGRHCELPTLPGKVFRYNGNDDRLELCVEPHGHFPIEPGIENKVLRSGLSATQDKDSDQMASLRDTLGSGSSGIIVNKPMQMPGQRPFSGQGHSMMSGSENIRMPHDLEMTSHRPRASSFHELNHDTPTSIVEEDEIAMEMDRKSSDGDSTMDERKEPAMFKRLGPGVTVLDHDTTNTVNSQTEMFQALASQIEDIVRDAEREDSDTEPRKISQVTDIVSETTQPPDGVATSEPMDSA